MTHCRVPPEPSVRARARNERSLFHSIGQCVRIEERQRPHTTYTCARDACFGTWYTYGDSKLRHVFVAGGASRSVYAQTSHLNAGRGFEDRVSRV
ncbi:hypothetical protein EVAR_28779_1 [Eumeta japonica]|uniref:Uncharacterized protein n=1 Tax=Eumeta variegata TaxID=151549 RepID=A0A4C1VGV2_EUMVA|nr:hypothetical protein EVAR_28779_1 [Eumeta japonica]